MQKMNVVKGIAINLWRIMIWYGTAAGPINHPNSGYAPEYGKPVTVMWFFATVLLIGIPPIVYFWTGGLLVPFIAAMTIYFLFGLVFWIFHKHWEW